ncbi:MAG: tetratricopeptide repeat protein [Alphaproteobacteria bacterium]|nr:tetratricopeptide repeat protein [Alphaproteobacteria bacterium]MCW5740565.1 tetratricopeptide repeat protein [Alphaproteobacteria bacterium]
MSSSPADFSPRGIAPIATVPSLPAAPKSAAQQQPQRGPAAPDDIKRWLRDAFEKQRKDDLDGAMADYRRVLAVQPTNRVAWGNLGVVYRKAKRPDMAVACYTRALEGDENDAGVQGNLGNAYKDLERFEESWAAHQRAIALDPMSTGLLHNYGVALSEGGMPLEARRVFDRVLEMDDGHVDTHWDRAICSLRLGDFSRQAWDDYEWRWKLQELGSYVSPTSAPIWRGEKLEGRTLLVYSEQGFGDTLFALRYLPRLKGLDGKVILRCQPDLMRLVRDVEGCHELASTKDKVPPHDLAMPIMSLLGRYTRSIDDIPPPVRLTIPASAGARALPRIAAAGSKFKVGIVWSGSVTFRGNLRRAVTLDRFMRFAEVPGVQLFSLQKGPPFEEYRKLAPHPLIVDLGSTFDDFADTAAALRQLDLVLMTDSSVAHLAGSLGVPIWDLVNFNTYWIYFMDRDDSPWYPSMRLFRQKKPGDWDEVFERAAQELARHVAEVRRA